MNRAKLLSVITGVVFLFAAMIFFANAASVGAAETCVPVKIMDRDNIEPLNGTVNTGDCIVWINFPQSTMGPGAILKTPLSDVLVSFPKMEGCNIDEVTTSTGFKKDVATSCFVAGWLRPGQTSSLVFKKAGTYKYDIQFRVGKDLTGKTEGTITVK